MTNNYAKSFGRDFVIHPLAYIEDEVEIGECSFKHISAIGLE